MIPKIIHFIWVGGNPKSKDIQRCMKSWDKHLKNYKIMEWDENNFDVESHPFIKQAYKEKKWAYVSDYIRAAVIYEYGGIYLDTDVLVLDDLTKFLNNRAFVGFENPQYPFTAVFGAEAKHPFVKKMLDYYDNVAFTFDVNDQMKSVNTKSVSNILVNEYHCICNNEEQILQEGIHVYPAEILCNPSKNSGAIHIFTGTWMEGRKPLARKIVKFIKLRLTNKFLIAIYNKII